MIFGAAGALPRGPRQFNYRTVQANGNPRRSFLDYFVWASVLWLLIGPRIEIVQVADSSVRFEDLVLAALALVTAQNWSRDRRQRIGSTGIAFVITAGLIACAIGVIAQRISPGSGILYALRPLEYWFVMPCAVVLLDGGPFEIRKRWITSLLAVATAAQVGVCALQYLGGFAIGFSKFSYERGAGLAAGPYELGAICAMLACFWFSQSRYGLFIISVAGIAMSQSRISMAAVVIAIGLLVMRRNRQPTAHFNKTSPIKRVKSIGPITTIAITLGVVSIILLWPTLAKDVVMPALERFGSTSILTSWANSGSLSSSVGPVATSADYNEIAYGSISTILRENGAGDASNLVRFYRWHILLNSMSGPLDLGFGLGPSFPGPSVDGAFLRIFIESGLLGVAAWVVMFTRWFRSTTIWFAAAALTLLIGSVFIDLTFALRPMVLFWLLFAVAKFDAVHNECSPTVLPNSLILTTTSKVT